ncbi:TraE protein, partial [human gut metagenome]
TRTVCAALTDAHSPSALPLRTSVISWPSRKRGTAIFEHLCDLYNYVDASIHVQLSFLNRKVDPVQYAKSFEIAPQGDDFDDIRAEYTAILQKQLASGNNGIVKTKYLTFTIEADSLKTARAG